MEGLSTLEVSKMVGTSLTMIEKHYGHLVTETARERLAKVCVALSESLGFAGYG
jgi:hypothetical protein